MEAAGQQRAACLGYATRPLVDISMIGKSQDRAGLGMAGSPRAVRRACSDAQPRLRALSEGLAGQPSVEGPGVGESA
jgi:hypothetical protein